MKNWALLLGAAIVAAASTADAAFVDGTFEATTIPANSFVYNPSSAAYTFSSYSGLANGTNGFGSPTGSGNVGFVQRYQGTSGVISQSFSLAAGSYLLSFQTANRPGPAQSAVSVMLDGITIAVVTPTTTTLSTATLATTLTGTANHVLSFTAVGQGTDTTTFLDNIAFTPTSVPEPASVAMLGLGLAAAGVVARRTRRTA